MIAFPLPIGVAIITILIILQIMHDSCRIMKVIMATPIGRAKRKKERGGKSYPRVDLRSL